jgi:hypothetical protein
MITRRLHIEMVAAKTFRTIYSLFKNERLNTNIKLTLPEALIRIVMTYACPACELAADTYLLKLQRLQNRILCRKQNHENEHVRSIRQGEARHRKYKSRWWSSSRPFK